MIILFVYITTSFPSRKIKICSLQNIQEVEKGYKKITSPIIPQNMEKE